MILVNSQKAMLRQFNRGTYDYEKTNYFDDMNYKDIPIKVVPYDVEQAVRFGAYTVREATGYFQVGRNVDVLEGDQITFVGKFLNRKSDLAKKPLTVLKVQDNWLYNRVENKWVAVK